MQEHKLTREIAGKEYKLSTGKLAQLSAGAVLLQLGGTTVLATADIDQRETELDYFPLSVEYIEKMYASGQIPGSRFVKSEGHPSEDAIIKARQVDHSIRSLFPKGFKKAVGVIVTVLTYDGIHKPEALAVLGASAALSISGAPYFGPSASVIAAIKRSGEIEINPTHEEEQDLMGEYVISATNEKILSIEGWSDELPEDKMAETMDRAMEIIKQLCDLQRDFAKEVAKPIMEYSELPVDEALIAKVKDTKYDEIKKAMFAGEKSDRRGQMNIIKKDLNATLAEGDDSYSALDIDKAVEYIARNILREGVINDNKRVSGRDLYEIRPLTAEVDVLPTVHGSALFSRGLTQALSVVALASKRLNQIIDGMEGEYEKGFMHQYNMPNYTVGEVGRFNYRPGRREVGHGMIGENGLRSVVANQEDFAYAIRVVSEVLTSNGSTSMASTCAASMALMAAGVPMKRAVAGIGVGLVTEDDNEDNYKLLLDIEGIEDYYGDMDFKVTGTTEGITAMQYENKLRGVKVEVLKEALQLAHDGRMKVLEVMNAAISESRKELADNAPRNVVIQINPERIGELIGPGGKNIKGIIEALENKAEIDIEDSGRVIITAKDREYLERAEKAVRASVEEPEIGKIYDGVIDKVMEFGAFVNVSSAITGLIHVSELSSEYVKDPKQVVKSGQKVRVRLIKVERGKQSFTMRDVKQPE